MARTCFSCGKLLTTDDLNREETAALEAERTAVGLGGIRFRYYHCLPCGHATIFLEVHRLDGETQEAFLERRRALKKVAKDVREDDFEVVVR